MSASTPTTAARIEASAPVVVNLSRVILETDKAATKAEALDKAEVTDKATQADVSRRLLHLADTLQTLANQVRSEYWRSRGEESLP